ncbi:MAG: homoserine kinase, partial [Acidobacteria bacterium]|nr:homoserine kinase [Acidobacteriota bacterium]
MRAVLPKMITRADAIYNLQRSALLQAALAEKRFELINEALRDRLHQPFRAPLAAGIADVLKLNDETDKHPGLLGVAISGAGSTMIAFVLENGAAIADEMQARFAAAGVTSRALEVTVDNLGRQLNPITT